MDEMGEILDFVESQHNSEHAYSFTSDMLKGKILDVDVELRKVLGPLWANPELRKANLDSNELVGFNPSLMIDIASMVSVLFSKLNKYYIENNIEELAYEYAQEYVNSGEYDAEIYSRARDFEKYILNELKQSYGEEYEKLEGEERKAFEKELESIARLKAMDIARDQITKELIPRMVVRLKKEAEMGFTPVYVFRELYSKMLMSGSGDMGVLKVLFTKFIGSFRGRRKKKGLFSRQEEEE